MVDLYISKEVGCRIYWMRNPPLSRNCDWENSVKETKKFPKQPLGVYPNGCNWEG